MNASDVQNIDLSKLLATVKERQLNEQELALLNANHVEFDTFIGLHFTDFGPERIAATVEADPRHHQPAGQVNGGVFCSIGESMGSYAGFVAAGVPVVGMNNNTDLIRPVTSGTIEAEAIAIHVGRRTQIWRIEMKQDGKIAAITTLRTMVMG
ncbi:PaaI family thioesterase [Corynebacterium urinipleomorphum]|uniref:PaaI family thioesterase n=1 Tax=Corynebacterium urinipleomorphum TaxID=1852380 RepID=UPI000B34E68B|nr:PaaI family thioesterase [Corynebacterium urinipleomorphum]